MSIACTSLCWVLLGSVSQISLYTKLRYAKCHYAESRYAVFTVILSVIMLRVVLQHAVLLNVVAPRKLNLAITEQSLSELSYVFTKLLTNFLRSILFGLHLIKRIDKTFYC